MQERRVFDFRRTQRRGYCQSEWARQDFALAAMGDRKGGWRELEIISIIQAQ